MAGRASLVLATLVMIGTAAAGCALFSDRVPGCVSPSNEAGLLDEFAQDPVLTVSPSGSSRREEPKRQVACHRVGHFASGTAVFVQYDLSRDLGQDEVRTLYEPVAIDAGWTSLPGRTDEKALRFCRNVLDQPGELEINWQDRIIDQSDGKKVQVPGVLTVTVHLAEAGLADVDAQRRTAGC